MENVHRYSIFFLDDVHDGPLRNFPCPGLRAGSRRVREWEGRSEVSESQLRCGY
jgi:hypothetical protein